MNVLESMGLDFLPPTEENTTLLTRFPVIGCAPLIKISLFLVNWHAATSSSTLVTGVSINLDLNA